MENIGKVLKCCILGSSNEGVSAIDAAVDKALTEALLKEDGPGSPQDLKENLLNVKVSLCRRMGWKIFQGVLQHAEPKDDQ